MKCRCPECGNEFEESYLIEKRWVCVVCGYCQKEGFIKEVVPPGSGAEQMPEGGSTENSDPTDPPAPSPSPSPFPVGKFVAAAFIIAFACMTIYVFRSCDKDSSSVVPTEDAGGSGTAETTSQTIQSDMTVMENDIPDIVGEWVDTQGELSYMNIKSAGTGVYDFTLYSVEESVYGSQWNGTLIWDAKSNSFIYTDCSNIMKRDNNGNNSEYTVYENGSGSFSLFRDKLIWTDDVDDAGASFIFQSRDDIDSATFHMIRENAKAAPVTASLLNAAPVMNSGRYVKALVSTSWATSHIVQKGYDNTSAMLFDGNDSTSWQEGVDRYGIGEYITARLERNYGIKYIAFKLGNWREKTGKDYFNENAMPKAITIEIGNSYQCTIEFDKVKAEQWVELSREVSANELKFIIEDVYAGTKYFDTCINEITIYGR